MKRKAVALLLAVSMIVPNTGIPALAAETDMSVQAVQADPDTLQAQSAVTESHVEEDTSTEEIISESQREQDTTQPQTEESNTGSDENQSESADHAGTPDTLDTSSQTEDSASAKGMSSPADLSLQTELPAASVMNVDFSDQLATDHSETANSYRTIGNPVISDSSELHKPIANFDGSSAFIYPFDAAKYAKITNAVSIECMFKYNSLPSGEHDIFSNQQSGGIGLGLDGGKLTLFAHVGGSYRQPTAAIQAGQWIHAIGVVDGKSVKLYVNGELAGEIAASGPVKFTSNTTAFNFVIGGDSSPNNGAEYMSNAAVSFARLYDKALTPEQVKALDEKAFENADIQEPQPQQVNLGIISSGTAAEGSEMNVNLHANADEAGSVNKISYDLVYDPAMLTYEDVQHKMSGVTIDSTQSGRLKITSTAALATDDFRQYGTTRLGKLNFKINDVSGTADTTLSVENFHAFENGKDVTDAMDPQAPEQTIKVYAKNALDFNGDGVIGAGDVALAPADQKEAAADAAAIYPYKHAVVLTTDGGGQVWNPDEIYYTTSNSILPKKTNDPSIMAKRTNEYAMDLFNKEFATSYTAQAVTPSISGQNYSSMIHGIPWGDVLPEYQLTNTSAGQEYYADFAKDTPLYPSMFKAVTAAAPARPMAAFSEWDPILNGIIEADAAVIGKSSASQKSFYDVAGYIRSDAYNNTALVYMQSDYMDHIGHSTGYYNDRYWSELKLYDDYFKAVTDALKEKGNYEDTLIIANSDHGGNSTNHGSSDPSNMDIFIGLGGQTIDSGKKLDGGDNSDIAALALYGLRIDKPETMTGEVFDTSAFLDQEEMTKKNRDIEKVIFERAGKIGILKLENQKSQTRVIDAVINLDGSNVVKIDAKGGTILRQEAENGQLKLTISYQNQPSALAKITFDKDTSANVKVAEIMLGTQDGKEIYSDLANTQGIPGADMTALNSRIAALAGINSSSYTKASWAVFETALKEARTTAANEDAAQNSVDNALAKLNAAFQGLIKLADKTILNQKIASAAGIKQGSYTDSSFRVLQNALTAARTISTKENASQNEVDNAIKSLANAVSSLTLKKPVAGNSFTYGKLSYKVTSSSSVKLTGMKRGASLKSLTIPSTVKYLNTTLKVTAIDSGAFKGNKKLQKLTIGKNITSIGKLAFYNCIALKKVTMGSSKVTSIGDKTFMKCKSLTSITLPETVKSIGRYAFYGDKKLKSITIKSKKLKTAGTKAISGIHANAVIKVPNSKVSYYKKLLDKKGLKSTMTVKSY